MSALSEPRHGKTVGLYAAYWPTGYGPKADTITIEELVEVQYDRGGDWFVQDGDEQASAACPSFEDAADKIRRLGYRIKHGAKWEQPHPNGILCIDVQEIG